MFRAAGQYCKIGSAELHTRRHIFQSTSHELRKKPYPFSPLVLKTVSNIEALRCVNSVQCRRPGSAVTTVFVLVYSKLSLCTLEAWADRNCGSAFSTEELTVPRLDIAIARQESISRDPRDIENLSHTHLFIPLLDVDIRVWK